MPGVSWMASGRGGNQRAHDLIEILDAEVKFLFAEEAVIDGDIEAALRLRIEEAVQPVGFHGEWLRSAR